MVIMDNNLLEEDLIDDSLVTGNFPRRGGPQAGRRKDKGGLLSDGAASDDGISKQDADGTPINKKKAAAGWGDDSSEAGDGDGTEMFGGASKFTAEDAKDEDPGLPRAGSDDDIPIIPDLEDQREEETLAQIADAPKSHGTIKTIRALDNDIKKSYAGSLKDSGIDVSLLAAFIHEPAVVQEEMEPWTWDTLFTSVASELRNLDEKGSVGPRLDPPKKIAAGVK